MALKPSSKIFTHVWYAREAEEAATFYASVFPDSRIDRVTPLPATRRAGRRAR
jgi:predicted 3-demethylubiquinone-9 3-methyltransferase (glyoxalase superfamily)